MQLKKHFVGFSKGSPRVWKRYFPLHGVSLVSCWMCFHHQIDPRHYFKQVRGKREASRFLRLQGKTVNSHSLTRYSMIWSILSTLVQKICKTSVCSSESLNELYAHLQKVWTNCMHIFRKFERTVCTSSESLNELCARFQKVWMNPKKHSIRLCPIRTFSLWFAVGVISRNIERKKPPSDSTTINFFVCFRF